MIDLTGYAHRCWFVVETSADNVLRVFWRGAETQGLNPFGLRLADGSQAVFVDDTTIGARAFDRDASRSQVEFVSRDPIDCVEVRDELENQLGVAAHVLEKRAEKFVVSPTAFTLPNWSFAALVALLVGWVVLRRG